MDITNFTNFSKEEYAENLLRLSIVNHCDLVNKQVYYSKPLYGKHKIESWNKDTGEYLLSIDNHRFHSTPFRILNI